ncbi:MAG: nucleotidyl transferase AbiEii/AbiGii toxin family protein, partial [Thermoplasmata archaeon]
EQRWIEEALWANPEAARVFLAKPRIVNATDRGISYPIIECRAVGSGRNPITVKLSINWSERLELDPIWRDLEVHGVGHTVKIPTVDDRERAAEKVRAFLDRADVNDAFDLSHFAARGWKQHDWNLVARLVPIKLQNSTIKPGANLLARFDQQLAVVKAVWPGDMVVSGGAPAWGAVEAGVLRFRDLLY